MNITTMFYVTRPPLNDLHYREVKQFAALFPAELRLSWHQPLRTVSMCILTTLTDRPDEIMSFSVERSIKSSDIHHWCEKDNLRHAVENYRAVLFAELNKCVGGMFEAAALPMSEPEPTPAEKAAKEIVDRWGLTSWPAPGTIFEFIPGVDPRTREAALPLVKGIIEQAIVLEVAKK